MDAALSNEIIFGVHPVIEALKAGVEMEKLLIQNSARSPQISEIMRLARQMAIPFQLVPIEKLNRLTRKNHQGVIAMTAQVSYQKLSSLLPMIFEAAMEPFLLVLDRITDVRNMGAIARSAEASGVHALVVPNRGSAQINAEAIKTSTGALHRVNICREDNLKTTLHFLKESGLKIVAVTEKASVEYWKADLSGPVALILGAEDTGISEEYLKLADVRIKMPMLGEIQSLNVSVAAGIACYEVVRQRHQ
ncbi:MAG: 23S rRNA (guanosine(2251)-2'-O)-methyltransferase RlmB [Bacteroidales bacterium]|nr:23S rRNA (guanosine(2251)-2'-O)-methyltransferase RlmB [Bacteroidales bacterium]